MTPRDIDAFYANVPLFRGFRRVIDQAVYHSLPDDWVIGLSDVVSSGAAIRIERYKAVNMAGAAAIAAVANALGHHDFPFVFGGDGASFAVPAGAVEPVRDALAATATWVREDLDLALRVALVPVARIRAAGHDVRVARYAPSAHLDYAMFTGGGLRWAEAAMKRGEFMVDAAPAGARPDLTGLSCRFAEIDAVHGVILSLLIAPAEDRAAFEAIVGEVIARVEASPLASRPMSHAPPPFRWPPAGIDLEARATRPAGGSLTLRRAMVAAYTFMVFLLFKFSIRIGGFVPETYLRQLVENTDYRKYDDGLRMVIDCTPQFADELERWLVRACADGKADYGLHRQDRAIMTCFVPSPLRADHVHFVDGASGGYASAASALKEFQAARIGRRGPMLAR